MRHALPSSPRTVRPAQVIAALLAAACCPCPHAPTPTPAAAVRPARTAGTGRTRGTIVEAEPGRFRYDYNDAAEPDSHVAQLQAQGYNGGAPTWDGIIHGLLTTRSPALLSKIEVDIGG